MLILGNWRSEIQNWANPCFVFVFASQSLISFSISGELLSLRGRACYLLSWKCGILIFCRFSTPKWDLEANNPKAQGSWCSGGRSQPWLCSETARFPEVPSSAWSHCWCRPLPALVQRRLPEQCLGDSVAQCSNTLKPSLLTCKTDCWISRNLWDSI